MSELDKKSLKQQSILQINVQLQNQKISFYNHPSPYKEQYENFFKKVPHQTISSFQDRLRSNSITYFQSTKTSNPQNQLQIIDATNNFSVVNVSIYICNFQFQVRVLNLKGTSATVQNLKILESGANGRVYYFENQSERFVVKNVIYKNNSNQNYFDITKAQSLLHDFLVEFCFCKLFSALRIGPLVKDCFGFDMVIYDNSAEFAMEYCPQLQQNQQFLQQDLSQGLKLMHSLKIVHGDIKPSNLRYSQSYRKAVFIDFGFCFTPDLAIGDTMLTSFFGTPPYCCEQMKEALLQRKKKYVDVFYNDVYALKMCFEYFVGNNFNSDINKLGLNGKMDNYQKTKFSKYKKFIININLKNSIYQKNIQKVKQLSSNNLNFIEADEIMEFIAEMKPSYKLVNIFNYLFKYFYPHKRAYKQLIFFYGIKLQNEQNKQFNFSNRIKQKLLQSVNYLLKDEITTFIELLYKQDISQVARIQKQNNIKLISKSKQDKNYGEFWKLFVLIVENVYTTKDQLVNILQMATDILGMDEQEQPVYPSSYRIPMKIIQIRKRLLKSGVDLIKYSMLMRIQKASVSKEQFRFYLKCSQLNIKQADQLYQYIISEQRWDQNKEKTNRIKEWLNKNCNRSCFAQLFVLTLQNYQTEPQSRHLKQLQIFEKVSNIQKITKTFFYFNVVFHQLGTELCRKKCEQTINNFHLTLTNFNHFAFHLEYIQYFYFYTQVFSKFANKTTFSNHELIEITHKIKQCIQIVYEFKKYRQKSQIFYIFLFLNQLCIYCRSAYEYIVYVVISKTITKELITIFNHFKVDQIRQDLLLQIYHYLHQNAELILEEERIILQSVGWKKQQFELFENKCFSLTIYERAKKITLNNSQVDLIQKLVFICDYQALLQKLKIKSSKQYKMSFDLIIEQFKLKQAPLNEYSVHFFLKSLIFHSKDPKDFEQENKYRICDQYLIHILNDVNRFHFLNFKNIRLLIDYMKIRQQNYACTRYIMHFIRLGFMNQRLIGNSLTVYPLVDGLMKGQLLTINNIELMVKQLEKEFQPYLQITKHQFFVIYADLIIIIQNFLYILIKIQAFNQVKGVLIGVYLIKIGSKMCFNCKNSFLRSRFINVVKFMSYYMINKGHIFLNCRRRKDIALWKCLRASQFILNQLQMEQLRKKISKRWQKIDTQVIQKVKVRIVNEMNAINENKKQYVECPLQNSQLLESHLTQKTLFNQKQVVPKHF